MTNDGIALLSLFKINKIHSFGNRNAGGESAQGGLAGFRRVSFLLPLNSIKQTTILIGSD